MWLEGCVAVEGDVLGAVEDGAAGDAVACVLFFNDGRD